MLEKFYYFVLLNIMYNQTRTQRWVAVEKYQNQKGKWQNFVNNYEH